MSNEVERIKVQLEIADLGDVLELIEINCDISGLSVPKMILQLEAKRDAYEDCLRILNNNDRI